GKTYREKEDGTYEFLDKITDNEDGLSTEQAAGKYLTFQGGLYPSMSTQEYFTGAEGSSQSVEAVEPLKPYLIENPWEPFQYTEEEYRKLAGVGSDIEKYVIEMRDKFIKGNISITEEWDEYVDTLKSMGLDDYMKI